MGQKDHRICHLGLGSNLGRPADNLAAAIAQMATHGVVPLRVSSIYKTRPVGYTAQPDFLNCVIAVRTTREPYELLERVQRIETMLGRKRPFPNAPRTIDIDILLCEDTTMDAPDLTIPHPRMGSRQFVLVPLYEIAPDIVMAEGRPLASMVNPDEDEITRLGRLADVVHDARRGG